MFKLRVFNKVILFYVLEENVGDEDLLMKKLLEISYCQRCKHVTFMKGALVLNHTASKNEEGKGHVSFVDSWFVVVSG
ncbi:uncharacterized protein LOC144305734 [Canis aureus]